MWMGLRDKTVEFEPHDEMDAMVKSLIDELQPSVIISFYPKFAVHPDHEATAEAVVRTVGRMAKEYRPVQIHQVLQVALRMDLFVMRVLQMRVVLPLYNH